MKINYASGRRVLNGWFNIDAQQHPRAPAPLQMLHTMKFTSKGELIDRIDLKDDCADIVEADHFIEHVYRWEADAVIGEFRRLLKPGGKLILELPNLESACKNFLAGMPDQMCLWPLYGNPQEVDPLMCHKWGYSPAMITQLLKNCKMRDIQIMTPRTHKKRANRDMRVECIK